MWAGSDRQQGWLANHGRGATQGVVVQCNAGVAHRCDDALLNNRGVCRHDARAIGFVENDAHELSS
jgi:hypothetical protein